MDNQWIIYGSNMIFSIEFFHDFPASITRGIVPVSPVRWYLGTWVPGAREEDVASPCGAQKYVGFDLTFDYICIYISISLSIKATPIYISDLI